jgi:hypothetical protein
VLLVGAGLAALLVAVLCTGLGRPGWMRAGAVATGLSSSGSTARMPAGEVPGEVPLDPDPTSPTGRAQGFIAAVNSRDTGAVRGFTCSGAYAVDQFVETAVRDGAQLGLSMRIDPIGQDAQVRFRYAMGGDEHTASGILSHESGGWCIQTIALLAA